jgi:hypothetical protein
MADTAMMFERLAARRGIAVGLDRRLLPGGRSLSVGWVVDAREP